MLLINCIFIFHFYLILCTCFLLWMQDIVRRLELYAESDTCDLELVHLICRLASL